MLKKNERMYIVATKLHHPRLAFAPSLLSLFFLTCNTAHKGINQSRYHPATMTIVQISKRKNTVISLFNMPSYLDPVLSGTEARLTTLSLYLSYSKEGQRIKDTRGFRGSNMENLSLVIIDVAGRHSFSANATHSKRPTRGERAGKLQSHRNDCSATLAPVRMYLERRRDASTRERARPPLWLPSSFSFSCSFSLSLGNSLPLSVARGMERTDGERRKHTGETTHTVFFMCEEKASTRWRSVPTC